LKNLFWIAAGAMFAAPALAAPGDLDDSFGSAGEVIVDFWSNDRVDALRLLDDGRILAFSLSFDGDTNTSYASLTRRLADGAPDPEFGENGALSVLLDSAMPSFPGSIALQPDGRALVAGVVGRRIAVGRLLADGTTDTAFGTSGVALADFGSSFAAVPYALTLQGDGKIVVAGKVAANNSPYAQFALVRFNTDGTLDTSFSDNGLQVSLSSNEPNEYATAVAVQGDGKIVAAGRYNSILALARYNTDGSPDLTFACDGFLVDEPGLPAFASHVAIAPNGAILVGGLTCVDNDCAATVVRYLGGGARDPAFGANGKATIPGIPMVDGMDIQPDGAVLVAGTAFAVDSTPTGHLYRLAPDGTADAAFSDATPAFDSSVLSLVQADAAGGVLVAGQRSASPTESDALVARIFRGGDGTAQAPVAATSPPCGLPEDAVVVEPPGASRSHAGALGLASLLGALGLALLRILSQARGFRNRA
jgi:uncharacterized delta-60 repeat protein